MFVPNLGYITDWEIYGYGDVGVQTMLDSISRSG